MLYKKHKEPARLPIEDWTHETACDADHTELCWMFLEIRDRLLATEIRLKELEFKEQQQHGRLGGLRHVDGL